MSKKNPEREHESAPPSKRKREDEICILHDYSIAEHVVGDLGGFDYVKVRFISQSAKRFGMTYSIWGTPSASIQTIHTACVHN